MVIFLYRTVAYSYLDFIKKCKAVHKNILVGYTKNYKNCAIKITFFYQVEMETY
jgi:hypothetical protein